MSKKETISLIDTFSEFKELKNIDRSTLISVMEESFRNVISKMFGMMLPKSRNNLKLSNMNMAGMGPVMIKSLMKKKNVMSLDEMFRQAAELGIEITVCEMSMDLMGFKKEEIIDYPHLRYAGATTFVADAGESAMQLFI